MGPPNSSIAAAYMVAGVVWVMVHLVNGVLAAFESSPLKNAMAASLAPVRDVVIFFPLI
jgi:hypothetical protein